MTDLTAVSLFAGIEGFGLALHRAGVHVKAAVEIDTECRGVIARHFPGVALFDDVRTVTGDQLRAAGFVPSRGIITAGFPCFAAGTRILAERGWVPIEDVVVGDQVLTHTGRWQPVTSVMSRVSDHTIHLRGQGLPRIQATAEHPFYARSRHRQWVSRSAARPAGTYRRVFSAPDWTDAAKMADQYASQILPPTEPSDGSTDLWWLVGRYLADGWTTSSGSRNGRRRPNRVVVCCAHDEADELAERIAQVVHATRAEDLTTTKFTITRAWFVQFVDRLGRGAAAKTLTRRELALPADEAEALLAGWLSGDGCRARGYWKGTTVSRSLALSMALLAQRARGVVASLHEIAMPPSDVIAGRVVGQRTQYQVVIPDRNSSAFIEGEYGWKLVRSAVRSDGPVLVYNLSVAGDESYVADGAIVHNCQDLSIAGRRTGLGGARSGLFWEIMRLAGELSPRWLVLENVPGLLSAVCSCPGDDTCTFNGRAVRCGEWRGDREHREWFPNVPHGVKDGACAGGCMERHGGAMGTVLGALGKSGYGFAYRVLDAQFFGVPQRRERVFIAGCLGDRAAPVQVLLEPESSAGDSAPGGQARQGAAGGAANGAGSPRTVGTLGTTSPGGGWRVGADEAAAGQLVANTAYTVHAAESCARERHAFETTTARSLDTTGGFASNQGGTLIASTLQGGGRRGHRVDAEGAAGGHLVPVAPLPSREVSACDTSREGKGADSDATSGNLVIAHTLTSEGFDASEDGTGRSIPIVPMGMPQNQGHAAGLPVEGAHFNGQTGGKGMLGYGDKPTALQASQVTDIHQGMAVRRLTPLECERLMGLPDNWTKWLADGTEQSDSARYRQCGNSVAVPVVEWVARRLVAADAVLGESEAVA